MHIPEHQLTGDEKTIDVTFQLAPNSHAAKLDDFMLKVTLADIGGSGSQVSYKHSSGVPQTAMLLAESLAAFSTLSSLTPEFPDFKVPITLKPSATTKEIQVELELFYHDEAGLKLIQNGDETVLRLLQHDQTELAHKETVTWKVTAKPANLVLSTTSPTIEGDQKTIQLEIQNQGPETIPDSELSLKITRKVGNTATVAGSTWISNNVYTLGLPGIKNLQHLAQTLTIDPKNDTKVTWEVQLQYQKNDIASPVTISWQKEQVPVEVTNLSYDRTSNEVNCTVKRSETTAASQANLLYTAQGNNGVKLADCVTSEVPIHFQPGEETKKCLLGRLEFNGQESATFEFSLKWEKDAALHTAPPQVQTFTTADINLGLQVSYDPTTRKATVEIENTGNDPADGLELVYKNTSPNGDGQRATLNMKTTATLDIGELKEKGKLEQAFVLDLQGAEEAVFTFEVEYRKAVVATTTKTFEAKPIELSLVVTSPEQAKSGMHTLYGSENKINVTINTKKKGQSIAINDLKLVIQKEKEAGEAVISKTLNGTAISELAGSALGTLGDNMSLYLTPSPGVQEAIFTLQLNYKGKNVGTPVRVQWKEYSLCIEAPDCLVGSQLGMFKVNSATGYIDLNSLTVSLEASNGATFRFIKTNSKQGSASNNLGEIVTYLPNRDEKDMTTEGQFKINKKNKQKEAEITITIKRGTTVLATKIVHWSKKGIALDLSAERYIYDDTQSAIVVLKNLDTGKQVLDLSKLRLTLTNTAGASFTLKNVSGASIKQTIKTLTGHEKLENQLQLELLLKIDRKLSSKLATGVILEVVDKKGNSLKKLCLVYVSSKLIQQEQDINTMKGLAELEKQDYQTVETLLVSLNKAITEHKKLLTKFGEIQQNNEAFLTIIPALSEINTRKIETWTETQDKLRKIAATLQSEEALATWATKLLATKEEIQHIILNNSKTVAKLEDTKLTTFLGAPYDDHVEPSAQSIRASYGKYRQDLKSVHDFLRQNPSITGDLQKAHDLMEAELDKLHTEAQAIFYIGFENFQKRIMEQQKAAQRDQLKSLDISELDELYGKLSFQADILESWKGLAPKDNHDIGIPHQNLNIVLAERYQILAETIFQLTKHYRTKKQKGSVVKCHELILKVNAAVLKLAETDKNDTTNEARNKTADYATKITNFANSVSGKDPILTGSSGNPTKINSLKKLLETEQQSTPGPKKKKKKKEKRNSQ